MRDEESFKNYRREYKLRYAWIRLGKWTAEEFADWSAAPSRKKPTATAARSPSRSSPPN